MTNNNYFEIFDELDKFNVYQFKSHISSSQYLLAYNLVMQHAIPATSGLDWGTGSGHFSFFLLKQGFRVTAFSIEKDCMLSGHLCSKYPDKYDLITDSQSIKTIPFINNTFNFVSSIGVLEHVRESGGNEIDSLMEIKRILKPGGVFICYHLPNRYSWIESITKHIKNKHNHIHKYSKMDIHEMLKDTGFHLIETKRYGILPRLLFRNFYNFKFLTRLFNNIDILFSSLVPIFCQNHYFVAKKVDS